MRYRPIPNTDLQPSVICLGTGAMGGGGINDANSFALLDHFVAAGGNLIDTALVYSDWIPGMRNRSEKLIGRWLRERGCRDQILLSTKGAHPALETMHIPRMSRAEIENDLHTSLDSLGVDHVDLYWLHRDAPLIPVEEILTVLDRLRGAGKMRYYGISNWQVGRAEEARQAAARAGIAGAVATQNLWSLAQVNLNSADPTWAIMDDDYIRWHEKNRIAAFAYTPLANGYFRRLERGTLDQANPTMRSLFDLPINRQRFERLLALQRETGFTITQLLLGYLLSRDFPVFPIVGPQKLDDLKEALGADDIKLTATQRDSLP